MKFNPRGSAKRGRTGPKQNLNRPEGFQPTDVQCRIDGYSHDGRGVGRYHGQPVFVAGALEGELVQCRLEKHKSSWYEAEMVEVLERSPHRQPPFCIHYLKCGGCSLQHMAADYQPLMKQQQLQEQLLRIGKVEPQQWLAPVTSPEQSYRYRVKLHLPDGKPGFISAGSHRWQPIDQCPVLSDGLNQALTQLNHLELPNRMTLELTEDDRGRIGGLFYREQPLSEAGMKRFVEQLLPLSGSFYLQSEGKDRHLLCGDPTPLEYAVRLEDRILWFDYQPWHFTQVNRRVNQSMVGAALKLLEPGPSDRVLDLFSGAGNFSLPLATRCSKVTAVEGGTELVQQGQYNAYKNALTDVEFEQADLFQPDQRLENWLNSHNLLVLDPPRAGADVVSQRLSDTGIDKILYVSCNPSTLARDAANIVARGFKLQAAGILDMFPQTGHVESMALFKRR